ncbi:MAG TPA: hypothetical protein GX497_05580 [Bacillus bacterium]|nr:hypothetical protein [Bacillus sp. (in: firmicutes)]
MNKCSFCGRESESPTKVVGGYTILECCADCENEIEYLIKKVIQMSFLLFNLLLYFLVTMF